MSERRKEVPVDCRPECRNAVSTIAEIEGRIGEKEREKGVQCQRMGRPAASVTQPFG